MVVWLKQAVGLVTVFQPQWEALQPSRKNRDQHKIIVLYLIYPLSGAFSAEDFISDALQASSSESSEEFSKSSLIYLHTFFPLTMYLHYRKTRVGKIFYPF